MHYRKYFGLKIKAVDEIVLFIRRSKTRLSEAIRICFPHVVKRGNIN
jgi:hypothetical protein